MMDRRDQSRWAGHRRELLELLLRCDESLPEKKVGGIGQAQVVCHTFEVSVTFFLLHADGLEQERSATHIHHHIGDFPNSRSEFSSLYRKLAPFFEMSKQSSAKFDFVYQLAVDTGQTLLPGIHPHFSDHLLQYLTFT